MLEVSPNRLLEPWGSSGVGGGGCLALNQGKWWRRAYPPALSESVVRTFSAA